jgi:diguanylate cyclase (GGDEF)-like protein
VIFAAFLLGVQGAIGAVFVVAAVSTVLSSFGYGPIQHIAGDLQAKIVFLQFYLLVNLLCALPMAALLAQARRSAGQLARSNQLLAEAERTAHLGHWRVEIDTQKVFWSEEVYRIHGLPPSATCLGIEDVVAAYHPADRAAVEIALEMALRDGGPFAFEARIVRPDGTHRHVESHGQVELADGLPVALFGVFLDVTEREIAIRALRQARIEAEERAEAARMLAETDLLTGIANRRKLLAVLKEEIAVADATGGKLSFILFDIDDFKAVNDTFGHAAGDEVLASVARIAAAELRDSDAIGRLGGEEFGVILPGADGQLAGRVAERIRASIAQAIFETDGLETTSVSLGIATYQQGADETWFIQAADVALYEAKRAGKNCYRLAA